MRRTDIVTREICEILRANGVDVVTCDKCFARLCFRPDILCLVGGNFIDIEIDERQHKAHDVRDELRRMAMLNLASVLGNECVMEFWRLGLDGYKGEDGATTNEPPIAEREEALVLAMLHEPRAPLNVLRIRRMFYDADCAGGDYSTVIERDTQICEVDGVTLRVDSADLRAHGRKRVANDTFTCVYCGKSIPSFEKLARHVKVCKERGAYAETLSARVLALEGRINALEKRKRRCAVM